MERALIVKPYWADLIVSGDKTWEIRSRYTDIRGKIGIIASSTKTIVGECEIVNCVKLTKELYDNNFAKHHITCSYDKLPDNYKNGYAWVIKPDSACKYDNPKPYKHPKGAVIWVKL